MTEQEALEQLQRCEKDADIEQAHHNADRVLLRLLISLGHTAIVKAWLRVPRWYS